MNKREVWGKVRNQKGRLKEAAGGETGSRRMEKEGVVQCNCGAVDEAVEAAYRKIGDAITGRGKAVKG